MRSLQYVVLSALLAIPIAVAAEDKAPGATVKEAPSDRALRSDAGKRSKGISGHVDPCEGSYPPDCAEGCEVKDDKCQLILLPRAKKPSHE